MSEQPSLTSQFKGKRLRLLIATRFPSDIKLGEEVEFSFVRQGCITVYTPPCPCCGERRYARVSPEKLEIIGEEAGEHE